MIFVRRKSLQEQTGMSRRVIPLNIIEGEEKTTNARHKQLERQRSIRDQAIQMVVDDNQPIIVSPTLQASVNNQLESRWRMMRTALEKDREAKMRNSPKRNSPARNSPARNSPARNSPAPNSQQQPPAGPVSRNGSSQITPLSAVGRSNDDDEQKWRHPEQMRCVLSCMLLAMRVLNLALLVIGALLAITAALINRVSTTYNFGRILLWFGIGVMVVSVTLGPFFCCCCGTSNYTCSFKAEGCLSIIYAFLVFFIFVCSATFASFVYTDGWNEDLHPYRIVFGARENVTVAQLFLPLQRIGLQSPPEMTLPLSFVILVGFTLAITVFSTMYSICLYRSYAKSAEEAQEKLMHDLEERELERLEAELQSSSTETNDFASVVAAKVAEAMEEAKKHTDTQLSKAQTLMEEKAQAELQAAIAKEKAETAKEHQQVKLLNRELSFMQERVKALERSHSLASPQTSPTRPAQNAQSALPEPVFANKESEAAAAADTANTSPPSSPTALRKRSSSGEKENKFCVVCWERPKNALLMPCKHLCTCYECATSVNSAGLRDLQLCPVCRTNIFDVEKIFMT